MLRVREKRRLWRRGGLWKWAALLLLPVCLYAGRGTWLRALGDFLVRPQNPEAAEVIVVLAGDGFGHRLRKAVELVRQGYAPRVFIDGPRVAYDADESKLAMEYAARHGMPTGILTPLPMPVRSTVAEAMAIDKVLQERKISRAIIVTSNFHTRRARQVFDRFGSPNIRYVVVEAPDEDFAPQSWWRSRDARKVLLMEYLKMLNWWLE